ncbi:MAG: O-antigen ligase family protein [Tannerella sp.]|jgi:tetratricopeptide (TPR) repeat protein|nr:O-antigen ligase family protein [Tannerella sp.]
MGTIFKKDTMNKKTNERWIQWIQQFGADILNSLSTSICWNHVLQMFIFLPFLLALSTVFVVSDDLMNGIISGKYFWFYGSMGLVCLTIFVCVLIGKHPFRFLKMDLLVLFFVVTVYLSAFFIHNASQNTTKLTVLLLLAILYFCLRLVLNAFQKTNVTQNMFCIFIIFTGLVEAVWGLRQLYGFEDSQHILFKLTGSFFNPGPYAGYLAMVFPLSLYYFLCKKFSILSLTTCIAILLVLPAAMSRASWLAVLAGSAVVVGGYCAKRFALKTYYLQYKRKVWIISYILILLLSAASIGMYFLKKDSADGRALTWKISVQTIIRHPFGVGLGNFPGAYGETQAAYFAAGKGNETEQSVAGNPEYGFNEYLQITVESGIIAFLLFTGIIILAVRDRIKNKDWGILGSLTALLVFAGFSYPFSVLPFLVVFVFLLVPNQWSGDNGNGYMCSLLPAVVCLLITACCLWKQYPVYQACKQWKTNRIYYNAGLFRETARHYRELYPYLNDRISYLFEYAQSLSKSGQPVESNAVLRRAMQISCDPMLYNVMGKNYQDMKQYGQAEAAFVHAAQLVPSRLYPWYLLTKLYDEMGMKDKVDETAAIVLTKEPKVQSPAVNEMREEVKRLKTKN